MENILIYPNVKENSKNKDLIPIYGVYLDGEIERITGFDIILTTKDFIIEDRKGFYKFNLKDGIYDCVVIADKLYDCNLYYWYTARPRGLVVLKTDTESNEKTQKKYKERREIL